MSTLHCQFKILYLLIIISTPRSASPHSGQIVPGAITFLVLGGLFCSGMPARSPAPGEISWAFLTLHQSWFVLLTPVFSLCPAIQLINYESSAHNSQAGFTWVQQGREVSLHFHRAFWHSGIRLRAAEGIQRRYSHCLTGSSNLVG